MGNDATGLFDIVLVGADSRLELVDVVPHVARLSGLPADTIGPRIAAGVPFFVARNLERAATRTQLEAYRAVGARVKPWQAGVPLPVYEAVAPLPLERPSPRVSGPAPRASYFVSDDPFVHPPAARTRPPSLTELDAPLEPVVSSASPAVVVRPPSAAAAPAPSRVRTSSSLRMPAVSGDRGGRR